MHFRGSESNELWIGREDGLAKFHLERSVYVQSQLCTGWKDNQEDLAPDSARHLRTWIVLLKFNEITHLKLTTYLKYLSELGTYICRAVVGKRWPETGYESAL